MRRGLATVLVLVLAMGVALAAPLSRTFEFDARRPLDLGLVSPDGLRIDSVRFSLPDAASRTAGIVRADVAVSNVGTESRTVGLAMALFDAEGRLLGVASGGTRVRGLKPGRQKSYSLSFDHVNAHVRSAATFQISLESE